MKYNSHGCYHSLSEAGNQFTTIAKSNKAGCHLTAFNLLNVLTFSQLLSAD